MSARKPVSKKLRFEVFKRDKFTCQYCGATPDQKVLHCDHVEPVAEGGEATLLNLITSCVDCNLGKGARRLSDDSAVAKQHRQLAEMEERRQQLEMMRQWRADLEQNKVDELAEVAAAFLSRSSFRPNDHGNISVRKWLKKYGLAEVVAAVDEAFDMHHTEDTDESWRFVFSKMPKVLSMRQQEKADPHIRRLLYIQGILRGRLDEPRENFVECVRIFMNAGIPLDYLEACAKRANTYEDLRDGAKRWLDANRLPKVRQESPPPTVAVERPTVDEEFEEARQHRAMLIEGLSLCKDWKGNLKLLSDMAGPSDCFPIGQPWSEHDLPYLRGFQCVGWIVPDRELDDDIVYRANGRLQSSFDLHMPPKTEPGSFFNRFGAMTLSSFKATQFSRSSAIYG